ncbi:MAG: uracil-DNA glycosylase [Chitinophagales bacterium]
MSNVNPKIEASWLTALEKEFQEPYFAGIKQFLVKEKKAGKVIYPPGPLIFNAFNKVPFDKVRVVIIGQDPYKNPGEAMGLSFSVPKGIKVPPSLRNIYKELATDIEGFIPPAHGDLTTWADQGVLLLNATLTLEHRKSNSHSKIGWRKFTDAVIKKLSDGRSGVVFMLWGNFAKSKSVLVDESKHLVLKAAHPSPLAGGAFFGNKHFSQANDYLNKQSLSVIDWKLS